MVRRHLAVVVRHDGRGGDRVDQEPPGVQAHLEEVRFGRCGRAAGEHARQGFEPASCEDARERVRLGGQRRGRSRRRQRLRRTIEEWVHRVAQAVGLRRAGQDLPESPSELLGETGEPRRPADPRAGLGQHRAPEGRELKAGEQRADVPERLVKCGDLDAHRVPQLRSQRVELGHAVLDALRPELWDAMSVEVAAFHESFGDISALLAGLQLPSLRRAVLAETGARIGRSSRLSRLAEQLGWALRQILPGSAEPDCLRNAVNPFFYRAPETLPPSGPSSSLTAEPHSFSRVFTGGWFEALAGMLAVRASSPTESDLLQVSLDAGRLLVDAIPAAPIVADYGSQVAAHLIESDAELFRGRYRDALKSALVRRGILSLQTASIVTGPGPGAKARRARRTAPAAGESHTRRLSLSADEFGFEGRALFVEAPGEARRFDVASAAEDLGSRTAPAPTLEARRFVEYLFRRGRVDLGAHGRAETRVVHPFARKTHELVPQAEDFALVRRTFDCGFDPVS